MRQRQPQPPSRWQPNQARPSPSVTRGNTVSPLPSHGARLTCDRVAAICFSTCGGNHSAAGVPLLLAAPKYCGDNAAMIAGLAFYRRNVTGEAAMAIDVNPTLQPGD